MTARHGVVWYEDQRVGHLREDRNRGLRFAYDADWLGGQRFPISIGLPLSNADAEVDAHSFFEGLLPEGRVRQRICRQHGLDVEDDTGLLLAIGEDCAGALSILPTDSRRGSAPRSAQRLTSDDIERLADSHGTRTPVSGTRQRFSLAGAQEKQTVIYADDRYSLPDRGNPSSHILKFETIPRVCFSEYLANRTAHRAGLCVVDTEFLVTESRATPYLRIERFDRIADNQQRRHRVHQEDLLQALRLPTMLKYESEGGPAIKAIADILREHTDQPVEAIERLRDWQIFNYLIGNWDGHAKNLALLYQAGHRAPVLAPFYDLVSIEFFNRVRPGDFARELAFKIGGESIPERITRPEWQEFAGQLGVPPKPLLNRLDELANALPKLVHDERKEFAKQFGDQTVYEQLERAVRNRCRWTLNTVFGKAR